ncbi:hypothetical protein DM01DRAFT_1292200 [Hesseltinella vesiculosa]|uniref:Uncharacterized protein n=1 Tax=Hesseltinella vesiculosa TaxID=101127 RepID=A0A1X2G913_9FUNG|nr:hypothetical protein DM01DRAFT_1292200 [Hesseltinella vesiculosa]
MARVLVLLHLLASSLSFADGGRFISITSCLLTPPTSPVAFSTQCWEKLNGKQNLFLDGGLSQINDLSGGWVTRQPDDWVRYQQQYINVSMSNYYVSFATVGGCVGPSRFKPSGFIFQETGAASEQSDGKLMAIADEPLSQTVHVVSDYLTYFVDDHANLTFIPSWNVPDKQAILYEVAFSRGLVVVFEFFDQWNASLANASTGVLKNTLDIPDIVLPPKSRSIVSLKKKLPMSRQLLCHTYAIFHHALALCSFFSTVRFIFPPVRFLCRQPSHPVLLCIFLMIGKTSHCSFIFTEAWNVINSQSSIFHTWLPRAAKIIGKHAIYFRCYCVVVLFGLRVTLDLPTFVVTYARDLLFLVLNGVSTLPTLVANIIVLAYFIHRSITFEACDLCRAEFLQVQDIEEMYVKTMVNNKPFTFELLTDFCRIPYPVKISLSIVIYCVGQLIPVLLTHLVGVGGRIPTHICIWAPYLSQLQYHPNPMAFALRTYFLMKVNIYLTIVGAGGWFTGTLYFMMEIAFIGTLIVMAIQLPRAWDALYHHVGSGAFFASFFIALVVQMIQKRITRLLFLRNGTYFGIKNRSLLLHYMYFFVFTSMTRALTSYVVRTLKLLFRYPVFSLRVDRNAETWSVRRGDGGFIGYCGMLHTEHEFNNPIVLVFLEGLLHLMKKKRPRLGLCRAHTVLKDLEAREHCVSKAIRSRSPKARNRWFVAVTLIQNPLVRFVERMNLSNAIFIVSISTQEASATSKNSLVNWISACFFFF